MMFVKSLYCILVLFSSVLADGEIVFLQAPSSITFQGEEQLPVSLVKDVYSASMGFSVQQGSNWGGMKINHPFDNAAGVISVAVPGLSSLGMVGGHHFPLGTESPIEDTYAALEWRIMERFPYSGNQSLAYINLGGGKMKSEIHFGTLSNGTMPHSTLKHLNIETEDDKRFLEQIALLNSITKKIEQNGVEKDAMPDVYWFVLSGVYPLIARYGQTSKPVFEVKQLIEAALQRLTEAFTKAYDSKVLVAGIASDAPDTGYVPPAYRFRRHTGEQSDLTHLNLAQPYGDDFPIVFNLIFWFAVGFAYSLLAISLAIGNMDPGRDSIIYRMTSNRLKKDN